MSYEAQRSRLDASGLFTGPIIRTVIADLIQVPRLVFWACMFPGFGRRIHRET
jgi:hypothetical protein